MFVGDNRSGDDRTKAFIDDERRISGECGKLVGSDVGSEKARLKRASHSDCGRRIRVLGGITESLATDQRTALSASQNEEHFGQIAEARAFGGSPEIASRLFGNKPGNGGKISQGIDK